MTKHRCVNDSISVALSKIVKRAAVGVGYSSAQHPASDRIKLLQ